MPFVLAGCLAGLASLPHCFVMCGPVASCAGAGGPRALGAHQAGRLLAYVAIGAVAGALGAELVWLAADPVVPWIGALAVGGTLLLASHRVARREQGALVPLRVKRAKPSHGWMPFGLGLLTVTFPCASSLGALVLAAASRDALAGAATMAAFAVASAPALIGGAWLAPKLARFGRRGRWVFAGVLAFGALIALLRPLQGAAGTCAP